MNTLPLSLGILGCGDFLRWMTPALQASKSVRISSVFDPEPARAAAYAERLGASVAPSATALIENPAIDLVALFVPPWIRLDLVRACVAAGKHIITTKPLASTIAQADEIAATVGDRVRFGVIYSRTEDAWVEALKDLLEEGSLGKLALYKQDWIHHYPQWNTWATDPARNGGPFLDAMVHNLNTARYLMARPVTHATWFSDNHAHPTLACRDTEFMKVDFAGNGSAHLFITWAADLAVHSTKGNDREHIDQLFLVTDQGWLIRRGQTPDGGRAIHATRSGEERLIAVSTPRQTHFDLFVEAIRRRAPNPRSIPTLADAQADIRLVRTLDPQTFSRLDLSR